jgi:CO/xanthine dehydrogenase FAD-binding subunit
VTVRTPLSSLHLADARTLQEALGWLREDPSLLPLAGCTDVFVALNAGQCSARRFLNLWRLDELRGIDVRDNVLRLGALTTYTDVIGSAIATRWLPMLVEAAGEVGGLQIHNRGTLGGNLANASPAGDTLPVFAAADAIVVLRSVDGERRVPFTAFYTGYRASVRRPDELIVAIEVPAVDGRQWFRKVGTRAAQAISKVVMAAVRAPAPRIALGSVAPTVIRAREAERILANGGSVAEARAALEREIAPIDDFRSSARYRRAVAGNLLARFWTETGGGRLATDLTGPQV